MSKKKPAETGRPEKPIDWELVEFLCSIRCTHEEIAAATKVSVDTLNRRSIDLYEKSFADFYTEKVKLGKISLRRALWVNALGDAKKGIAANPRLLVHLAEQVLGHKRKLQHSGNLGVRHSVAPATAKLIAMSDQELDEKLAELERKVKKAKK